MGKLRGEIGGAMSPRLAGVLACVALLLIGGQAVGMEVPGVLWRTSFDEKAPILVHWQGDRGKKVPRHAVVTEEGRTAEQLNILYEAQGDGYDYWGVKTFQPVALTETTAIRVTLKCTMPVVLRASCSAKAAGWNGILDGPGVKGSGVWQTIEFRDILKQIRQTIQYGVKEGRFPAGAEKSEATLDILVLDFLAPGKETDIYVDEIAVVDTALYRPEADVTSLPYRVGWAAMADRPPVIDGHLTEADGWTASPALEAFETVGRKGPGDKTAGYLLFDAANLYVGIRLDGPPGQPLGSQATQRDGKVWADDCVELFIAPPDSAVLAAVPMGVRYYHLAVNAAGTQFDEIGADGPGSWDGDWSASASRGGNGWEVEVQVPFKSLGLSGPPAGVWRFNLCRCRHLDNVARYSSWSAVERGFHEPERFGVIAFGKGRPDADALSAVVLREGLRTQLSLPLLGLARSRKDLADIPDTAAGKRRAVEKVEALSKRATALADGIDRLKSGEVLTAREPLSNEINLFLADVANTELETAVARLGAKTPPDWPFVVLTGPAIINERFEAGKPPPRSFDAADRLSLFAARGEYEPVTFILYATEVRRRVTVSVTDLTGPAGTVPASAVDLRVVKYWFQAGDSGPAKALRLTGGILVPELLLKDDGLVVVDRVKKKNYMRTDDGMVDISDPKIEFAGEGQPLPGVVPRLLKLAPRDTKELQPFDVAAGEIKQIWFTLHVPSAAKAGKYAGKVCISVPGEKDILLPLELEVLPFDLAPSPIVYSLFVRGQMSDKTPLLPAWSEQKTEAQYRAEMADLLAHGVTAPVVNVGSLAPFVRTMKLREEVGLPKGNIYNVGTNFPMGDLNSQESLQKFMGWVKPFADWAKANGYDYYVFGVDESDELLADERRWILAAHEIGAKVFATAGQGGEFLDAVGDVLDLTVLAGAHNRPMARRIHDKRRQIGIYSYPQVGAELPETYRRNYGLALWQAGYDVAMTYAYQHSFGHIWNDFDDDYHKDHVFAYPTADGVVDTIAWEGFREAVDDVRYAATLMAAADRAKADPARRAKAAEAESWLRNADAGGDLQRLRREIVERILELSPQ